MNEQVIDRVRDELAAALKGATLVRVYQLSALRFALDLRSANAARPLLLAAEPARPRVYLIRRPPRELERESVQPSHFTLLLRKHLGGARLTDVTKDSDERVLRFVFRAQDELGAVCTRTLIAQLTGRSSNVFLLDDDSRIIDRLRPARGEGQETGETYNPPRPLPPAADSPPAPARPPRTDGLTALVLATTRSPSEVIEEYDDTRDRLARFREKSNVVLARLRRDLDKRTRLRANLDADLREHGDADAHKRHGDLLLANLANAERTGSRVRLTDYFAEDAPVIELEADENKPLQLIAAELFSRYARAKRAHEEAARRRVALDAEIDDYTALITELEAIIAAADETRFDELFPAQDKTASRTRPSHKQSDKRIERKHAPDHIPGTRRYRSSDSFEIVVGRGAKENDAVTFRLARPNDLWLHAADYPGAHVIVRNHTKLDIPHRTLVEAAQLAAAHSQAKEDSKVSVNYTPRKFISKPKGAAPGLVKLAQFKTLLVEPREAGERITT